MFAIEDSLWLDNGIQCSCCHILHKVYDVCFKYVYSLALQFTLSGILVFTLGGVLLTCTHSKIILYKVCSKHPKLLNVIIVI